MTEYIEREALMQELEEIGGCDAPPDSWADGFDKGILSAIKHVEAQPAADVVEVVRCKDCKYFFDECCNHEKNRVLHRVPDFGKHYSYVGRIKVEPDHYCGHGERKEGDVSVSKS